MSNQKTNNKTKLRKKATIYLDNDLMSQVVAEAYSKKVSQQRIFESAMRDRYSQESADERDALITRRFNRLDNKFQILEQQSEILGESLALYVRMWLTSTSELPEAQRDAAILQGQARYDRYLRSLGKRLLSGETIRGELPKEVALRQKDFVNKLEDL